MLLSPVAIRSLHPILVEGLPRNWFAGTGFATWLCLLERGWYVFVRRKLVVCKDMGEIRKVRCTKHASY